ASSSAPVLGSDQTATRQRGCLCPLNRGNLRLLDHGLLAEKIPPCFSSEGLAALVPKSLRKIRTEQDGKKLSKLIAKQTRGHVRYQAMRDVNIPRQMGIPHPQSYAAQCLAIFRCWDKIKVHCAKPTQPVSRIFVRQTGGDRVFEMSYKGAERFEIEEQDLGFLTGTRLVVHADISTCFPSIYTHSIPWALHGRRKAKTSRGDFALAGNVLDKATQALRDLQTNGLLIGPHSSNIVSEIILTSVDAVLIKKGYLRLHRHIDDYRFYARSHEEAENFVRDLGLALREFELALNEKKTRILPLPLPQTEYWVRELNAFLFPDGEIRFSTVRSFLDLALHLAQQSGTSAVLNYAIKMVPPRLNDRAKRLFTLEATNLALSYPYLAPLLGEHVFDRHNHSGLDAAAAQFASELMGIGIRRVYPDAIAHALHLAIKHNVSLPQSEAELRKIVNIDDCVCDVLLLEYSVRQNLNKIRNAVTNRADNLKGLDSREQDAFWLLIYQVWSEAELRSNGQDFLADLKKANFEFVRF
ncbi:MAG: RNA-directed DNA polymerase, partial [Opitutaceae bacterium]|nr:RNA-directed DNA polymerase [Opitutaceae bacterium]